MQNENNNQAGQWQGACSIDKALDVTAEDFIKALGYSGTEQVFCRVFDDSPAKDNSKAANRQCDARVFSSMLPELHRLNADRRGIYFVVCGGGNDDPTAKAKGTARAQFMEIDEDENGNKVPFDKQLDIIKQFKLEPSIIVKTAKSLHTYWIIKGGNMQQFREIQQRLVKQFKSDPVIVNESRVMRLPGFNHCKGDPVPVQVIKFDPEIKYTQAELAEALPEVPHEPKRDITPLQDDAPTLYEKAGGRNNAIVSLGGSLRRTDLNAEEISNLLQAYNNLLPEPLNDKELATCIKQTLGYKSRDDAEAAAADAKYKDYKEQHDKQKPQADVLTEFLQEIQAETYKPYSTGLPFFDNLLGGGVIRQSMLLLYAAPATGKTTLAQQIAEAMARNGKPVIYLNLEMSRQQMLAKAISARLSFKDAAQTVSATDVLQGYKWDDKQRERITAELEQYRQENAPFMRYNPQDVGADFERIKTYLHNVGEYFKEKGEPAPALFVDYLHLITSPKYGDPQELIKAAVAYFKNEYAIKYNSFVFVISATNRASNASGKMTMESGRDSSALEYTGDYVLALNYTEVEKGIVNPADETELAELKAGKWRDMTLRVLKHRLGTPGKSARMWFKPAANLFYDYSGFLPVDEDRDKIQAQAIERAKAKNDKKRSKQDRA